MHVTSKDSSKDGQLHTLTSVLEADGANELASVHAVLSAEVHSVERTASGGIEVQVVVKVTEPEPSSSLWGKIRSKK